MSPVKVFLLLVVASLALACQTTRQAPPLPKAPAQGAKAATSPAPPARMPRSELVTQLLSLGNRALQKGQWAQAEDRFRRVLVLEPGAPEARVGLSRIRLARGEVGKARDELGFFPDAAVGIEIDEVELAVSWAQIEVASGNREGARRVLYAAHRVAPLRYDIAGQLEVLSAKAPAATASDDKKRLKHAIDHHFHPASLVAGGQVALEQGDEAGARRWLEEAVWLADLDSDASRDAVAALGSFDTAWSQRRIVPVHVYADQKIRADPHWKSRVRLVWRALSVALDPLLAVAFVPVSLGPFATAQGHVSLRSIDEDFRATAGPLPPRGLIAVLTETPVPRRAGSWRLGQASFLGRDLIVRIDKGAIESRVLAHEILHVYGGVHVSDEVNSLMNPSGESLHLDPANVALARLTKARRFGRGGVSQTVLPHVDQGRLAGTYMEWLAFQLDVRRRGMANAEGEVETSRYIAAATARKSAKLDPHMADVAAFTGQLLLVMGEPEQAADLFVVAARLYGLRTARGREMVRRSEGIRKGFP